MSDGSSRSSRLKKKPKSAKKKKKGWRGNVKANMKAVLFLVSSFMLLIFSACFL